jgi:hypothetical protein
VDSLVSGYFFQETLLQNKWGEERIVRREQGEESGEQ